MNHNYRFIYLVVINGGIYVYKYNKYKFDRPFLSFQPKRIFIGRSKVCRMTNSSGALENTDFDGNTILLECGKINTFIFPGLRFLN